MAKKRFLGYKGKTSTKIILTAVTAGTLILSVTGASLFDRLYDKHQTDSSKENFDYVMVPEDNIHQIQGDPSNSIVSETETDVENISKPTPEESLGVEFVEVLAKLTNKAKHYIQSATNSAVEPNLTITGFSSIYIDHEAREVLMFGQLRMGENYSNFKATMRNTNNDLAIYDLPIDADSYTSEQQLIDALDEYVDDEKTAFSLELKQHIQVSNQDEVIHNILQTRLNTLLALNSEEQIILDEIRHLNKVIGNTTNFNLTIYLDKRIPSQNGYSYSFKTLISTGKYSYVSLFEFESNRILSTTAVKHNIEACLSNNSSDYRTYPIHTSSINKALDLISKTAFDLENEQTLTN